MRPTPRLTLSNSGWLAFWLAACLTTGLAHANEDSSPAALIGMGQAPGLSAALPASSPSLTVMESAANALDAVEEAGAATWYGPRFHGKRTASGERYNMNALTAAHPSLPFGTMLRVRSLLNGQEVTVRVNDRGPFTPGLIIDLSRAAANAIGMGRLGTKDVVVTVLPAHNSNNPENADLPEQRQRSS